MKIKRNLKPGTPHHTWVTICGGHHPKTVTTSPEGTALSLQGHCKIAVGQEPGAGAWGRSSLPCDREKEREAAPGTRYRSQCDLLPLARQPSQTHVHPTDHHLIVAHRSKANKPVSWMLAFPAVIHVWVRLPLYLKEKGTYFIY